MEHEIPEGVNPKDIESVLTWVKGSSLWNLHFCFGCCSTEIAAAMMTRFDIERFGFAPADTPRQADVLVANGPISRKIVPRIQRLWAQMPDPKYLVVVGACPMSGGPYQGSYNIVTDIRDVIDVEPAAFIPGCPPNPEGILEAFIMLKNRIKEGSYGKL